MVFTHSSERVVAFDHDAAIMFQSKRLGNRF